MKRLTILLIIALILTGCRSEVVEELEQEVMLLESEIENIRIDIEIENKTIEDLNEENQMLKEETVELKVMISELEVMIVEEPLEEPELTSTSLLSTAIEVMELIELQDFASVATFVDATLGLRFSPYSYINFGSDLWFSPSQVSNLMTDPLVYTWGSYDGSGDSISSNFIGYYNEFVYDETYSNPHLIGNNTLIGTGNMINNIATVYPTASFVEFYFTGFNPAYNGMDWSSLRLIFEYVSGSWKLIGIEHDQWTI